MFGSGKILVSNSSIVCADKGFTSTTDPHLDFYALVFRGSVLLKIISLLFLGFGQLISPTLGLARSRVSIAPVHSGRSRSDVLQSRRKLRAWIWQTMV